MQSEVHPYAMVAPSFISDVWESEHEQQDVRLDVLLPNGCYLPLSMRREASLVELKEEVWELGRRLPLSGLLRDSECYVFQCVNLGTGERDDLADERRRICDVRPFQAMLRLVERQGNERDRLLNTTLGSVIGIGMRELDKQKDSEVHDFRKQMQVFCESFATPGDSWETRFLRQYPVELDPSPELPPRMRDKLVGGNLVLAISLARRDTESTFKLHVPPSLDARGLLDLVLAKKGPALGLEGTSTPDLLLKVCGLEEFLVGPCPLSQYKYIRECLSLDKTPELILFPADQIQVEEKQEEEHPDRVERLHSCSMTSVLKRKQTSISASSWTVAAPLSIIIHSVQRLNHDNKAKVSVQCGLYHADERLTRVLQTCECVLEEGSCKWEEVVRFDIEICHLPRMTKLCLALFETSPTQKNGRFRKNQEKYVCPIAWVNTTVFDYKGQIRACPQTLSMWPCGQEDDYSSCMLRPLGWLTQNTRDPALLTFSFCEQAANLVYPSMEEILAHADKEASEKNNILSPCIEPQASKTHLQQLQQICDRDALYQLHEQEKELMWFLRKHCCEHLPYSLPKLLRCLKWSDRGEVIEMMRLLKLWPLIAPYKALELMTMPDPEVRSFAVRCLRNIGDEELLLYMLQMVQALRHEAYLDNALVRFLLERALGNRHVGHKLFWLLRSEIQFPDVSIRFALILEAYCRSVPSHLVALERQVDALTHLRKANNQIQKKANLRKDCKEKLKSCIQDTLGKKVYEAIFHGLLNPLDPRYKFGKIRAEKCKCLDSKMKPLWLVFENTDTYGKDAFLIFKNGDDLRQDMLTLQMIRIMDRLWKEDGLDLRMIPYQCMATGPKSGLIEVVPDADTIANIQKEKGFTATSAFKKGSILAWLKDHNTDDHSLSRAIEEFTLSCAGYCVATYVLGVADRHSDNIMVKTNGQLFHVDFGHILGKFKEKFGFKRERVPFVLTHDFVYIITRGQTQRSQEFARFQQHCERAFLALRRRGPLVISLFNMYTRAGIPELSSERDLDYLRDTLVLDLGEQDALNHFRSKFDEAIKNSWKTSINWAAHNLAKDNKMSE